MSDFDELERIAGTMRADAAHSRRSVTSRKNLLAMLAKGSEAAKAQRAQYYSAARQPSLAKLKFMGDAT